MSRILFADHNGFTQRMGIQFLSAEGHDVVSASGGADALRYIQEQRPDIAILDTQMPGPSGLELCWRIKSDSNLRDTKVVLLNRVVDPIAESEAKEAGSDALLVKPLDGPTLVGTVNSLIERMRSEIAAGEVKPEDEPSEGSEGNAAGSVEEHDERAGTGHAAVSESTNGANGLAALGLAVSGAAAPECPTEPAKPAPAAEQPLDLPRTHEENAGSNGLSPSRAPGRPVVATFPRQDAAIAPDDKGCAQREPDFSQAVDFAAIVNEALGKSTDDRELRRLVEDAIFRILRPAIAAVAESVTAEVLIAHRARRRVEEAVNGLLLPAVVSIAEGSSQGVLAAFRSK